MRKVIIQILIVIWFVSILAHSYPLSSYIYFLFGQEQIDLAVPSTKDSYDISRPPEDRNPSNLEVLVGIKCTR